MPRTRSLLGLGLALASVLVALTVAVRTGWAPLSDLDRTVGSAAVLAGIDRPGAVALEILTAPGLSVLRFAVLVPLAVFFTVRGQLRTGLFAGVSALVIGPLTSAYKDVVGRIRPDYPGAVGEAGGLSFPSGHASGAATLVGVLLVAFWPYLAGPAHRRAFAAAATAAVGLAVVVAWTRLALGVHFLSDVVAGLALGGLVVVICAAVLRPGPGRQPRTLAVPDAVEPASPARRE